MRQPWRRLKAEQISVIAPGGEIRCRVTAYYAGDTFIIDDMAADVRLGDEIRRGLPNGNEEAFTVTDPQFLDTGIVGPYYQITVTRPSVFPPHTGGNYNVTVTGPNARVNFQSTDNSTNIAAGGSIYDQARKMIAEEVADPGERERLTTAVTDLQNAGANKEAGLAAYHRLVANAANHMTVLAPFLQPLLNGVLG